jgi:hypothetical protein
VELDHVLISVGDLSSAVREFETSYGLVSVEGGRHARWGTANRIVPLGETYLELVAVVDPNEAAQSAFGRWVATSVPASPLGWAVRTSELDTIAVRLGLSVDSGSRLTPAGELLQWRLAGVEQSMVEPALPFFIEWASGTPLPGSIRVAHQAAVEGINELIIEVDENRLAFWLGEHSLPLTVRAGGSRVAGIVLSTLFGDVTIQPAST